MLRYHPGLCTLVHLMLLVIAPHMKLHFPQNLILLTKHIASLPTATGCNLGCQLNLLGYSLTSQHILLDLLIGDVILSSSLLNLTVLPIQGSTKNSTVLLPGFPAPFLLHPLFTPGREVTHLTPWFGKKRQQEESSQGVRQGLWKCYSQGDFAEWGVTSSKKSRQIMCVKLSN